VFDLRRGTKIKGFPWEALFCLETFRIPSRPVFLKNVGIKIFCNKGICRDICFERREIFKKKTGGYGGIARGASVMNGQSGVNRGTTRYCRVTDEILEQEGDYPSTAGRSN
jgi:hypothetical protein